MMNNVSNAIFFLYFNLQLTFGLGLSSSTTTTTTTASSTSTSLPFLPNDCSYCPNCALVDREQIFGGNSANRHQWPFMVSFGTQNETLHWSHFCGGSIVSNHTIISAAHCFYSSKAGGYKMGTKIRLGDANLNDGKDDMQMAQTYSINTILRHPLYRGRGVFHDVALIHTIEEIQFNQQTKPICMTIVPGAQDVEQDDQVQVAGWGYVDDSLNKTASDTLQETTLQVLNRSECQSKSGFNNDLIFCVGNPSGGSSSCKGDSGGPLVTVKSTAIGDTFKFLIGILHGSRALCNSATSDYPGVFANLTNTEIFSFTQKWKSLDSLFSADNDRSDDEWRQLLSTMTNTNPINEKGLKLSDHLLKTRPKVAEMIKDTNCDPRYTERKNYNGRCICKPGYAGRTCTTCDHQMQWNNMTSVTDCDTGHFMLVSTGYPYLQGQNTEVLDMKNPRFTCHGNLPDYPMEMSNGVGTMIGNIPLICGGQSGHWSNKTRVFYDQCYKLQDKQWVKSETLRQARATAGALIFNKSFLVSGGVIGEHKTYSVMNEYIGLQSSMRLQDLPSFRFNHCIVPLNDSHLMFIGGGGRPDTGKLYFNIQTEEFSQVFGPPFLERKRQLHGCISVKVGNRSVLFVTGGYVGRDPDCTNNCNRRTNSVKYLDLSQPENEWKEGQPLPKNVAGHKIVHSLDGMSVYIIGGWDKHLSATNKILKMTCPEPTPESCYFEEIPTYLEYPRRGHIALPISLELAKKLCQ